MKAKQTVLILGAKYDAMISELVAAARAADPLSNYGKTDLVRDMLDAEYARFTAERNRAARWGATTQTEKAARL